ncbi:protein MIX23-like [Styela clava]
MAAPSGVPCADIQLFMEKLKERRQTDDRIIHELNSLFPKEEFAGKVNFTSQCKDLYHTMRTGHSGRIYDITACIQETADKAKNLKQQRDKDPENYKISKNLRKEQGNLRLFQQELNVEEIVWERAEKAFYERCRTYYKPDS